MSAFRPPQRPLEGARVALLFSPGNVAIDYSAALVRGPERALMELGATVDTMTTAHHAEEILGFYARGADPLRDTFPEDGAFVGGMLELLESAPAGGWDLLLGYFYDTMLTPRVCEALRKHARRTVNYPLNLLDQTEHFRRALDLFDETWCSEEAVLAELRARPGLADRIRYVPMASDPFLFRALGSLGGLGAPPSPRVLFAGSAYGRRGELLARFAREIPVTVSGSRQDPVSTVRALAREVLKERRRISPREISERIAASVSVGAPLGDEGYCRKAAAHGISVGFNDVRRESTGEVVYKVRLREYDAAMTGLCHLARRLPELERAFDPGKEMLLYDDEEQAVDQLRRIARGEIDWRAIGRAARARAETDHSWTRRFYDALA